MNVARGLLAWEYELSPYHVDCPLCDADKLNDEPLDEHIRAVNRADDAAEAAYAAIIAAKEKKRCPTT